MRSKLVICLAILPLLFTSCSQDTDQLVINFFSGKDRSSPILLEMKAVDETKISLVFDEIVVNPIISISSPFEDSLSSVYENQLIINLSSPLPPMKEVQLEVLIHDRMGNSTTIEGKVYGKNFDIPHLVINEFSTKGSTNHPDRVEFKVLSDGNLAGVTFYNGMYNNYTSCYTFNSVPVKRGDYIVLQFQSIPTSFDSLIFYGGEEGLSSNNGVLSLYASLSDEIIDAIVYSNRTSDSDTEYGGFGTRKVFEQVEELTASGQWNHNGVIQPESAISSEDTSATRSFNRDESSIDSNSPDDWYIVETRGATFGFPNSTLRYTP